jgi:hypothetical protein
MIFLIPAFFLFIAFLHLRKACFKPEWKHMIYGFSSLLCGLSIVFIIALFNHFGAEKDVARVTISSSIKKEWVEWKNPSGPNQARLLSIHEVSLENMEGKNIGTFFVYGDQVSVKAKILRWHPFLNLLGFSNLCKIDSITNSYREVRDFNALPHIAYQVAFPHLHEWIWKFWDYLYFLKITSWLVKSATLESNEFPLIDRGGRACNHTYTLTISDGGLSASP